jgi:hypothetical protein
MTGFVKASGRAIYNRENRFLSAWSSDRTTTNTVDGAMVDDLFEEEIGGFWPLFKPWEQHWITRPFDTTRAALLSSVAYRAVRIPNASDYIVTWQGEDGRRHVQKGI